jgi:hypothetical protein
MVAWMTIITLLHTLSLAVFAVFVLINILIFVYLQDPIIVEPLAHSFLSIIFPVALLPMSNNNNALKLLFWLVLIGNLTLLGVLIILFVLYNYDIYNPWCSKASNRLLIPELFMSNFHYIVMSIMALATIPVIVCFVVKGLR